MFATGESADQVIARKGLKQEDNSEELEQWCREAIDENPKPVEDFKSGNEKAINSLKGQVMKKSRGKANPSKVDALLRELLV